MPNDRDVEKEGTYTWELDTAVTAFGRSSSLLDVQKSELATGSLDHSDVVRGGVVAVLNFQC